MNFENIHELKEVQIKKGQILQHKGVLNSKQYFVKSGLLRSYAIDVKGKEHIFIFAPENWTIADGTSPQLPSELFIDAIEDSVIYVQDKNFETSDHSQPLFNRISVLQTRVIMLMSSSAIERYEHFIETYADIAQRVPQRMIASYLGITPEALSKSKGQRIRKLS